MKKYFMVGLGIVLAISLSAIFYGAWLNERGEVQITRRMEERRLTLHGAKAATRRINPRLTVNAINLFSNDMADAVALVNGRIVEVLAPKGSFVRRGDGGRNDRAGRDERHRRTPCAVQRPRADKRESHLVDRQRRS